LAALKNLEQETEDCTRGTVAICFNYGGQWEISDAITKMIKDGVEGEITPELVSKYLYRPEVPPCDLIVRTSGEERISGFQLWRASYSEFMFLKKKFPAISKKDCEKILASFSARSRRFGR
jgi:undecaprenyl diphosphate synthase